MGSQVNYFLTPSDTQALEDSVRLIEPMTILTDRSRTVEPNVVNSLLHEESGERCLYFNIVRTVDLGLVTMKHIHEQNHWVVDSLRSPVIEVSTCPYDGKVLRRGRFYLNDAYYDLEGFLVSKPEDFCKWGQKVLRTARRKLKKQSDGFFFYIGTQAQKWERSGVVLSQL